MKGKRKCVACKKKLRADEYDLCFACFMHYSRAYENEPENEEDYDLNGELYGDEFDN